jgi:hypothetical protein
VSRVVPGGGEEQPVRSGMAGDFKKRGYEWVGPRRGYFSLYIFAYHSCARSRPENESLQPELLPFFDPSLPALGQLLHFS